MTEFEMMYKTLVRYGKIIADRNHETTEGNCIRFITFLYEDEYYVSTMFNGDLLMIAKKDSIRELL